MRAVLSCVHGNLEALTAVLADADRQGARAVCNLGDTLGYGPDPVACLDLAADMALVLLGNFDQAVLHAPDRFGQSAERSVRWTQARLHAESNPAVRAKRLRFLADCPRLFVEDGTLYVHGSARNPLNDYVFPEDIYCPRKMAAIGERFGSLCLAGHTHLPGLFRERRAGDWEFLHPDECIGGFPVVGEKVFCTVGSVGQPRDGDGRACYVLFDGARLRFRRVEYDVAATARKIRAIPELDDILAARLFEGR
jgi:diadenosine tetraphosphatase ApaH/serine/threonine PP2A family protein phosphatase